MGAGGTLCRLFSGMRRLLSLVSWPLVVTSKPTKYILLSHGSLNSSFMLQFIIQVPSLLLCLFFFLCVCVCIFLVCPYVVSACFWEAAMWGKLEVGLPDRQLLKNRMAEALDGHSRNGMQQLGNPEAEALQVLRLPLRVMQTRILIVLFGA